MDKKISEETVLTKDGTERIPVIQSDGSGGWINGALPISDFGGENFASADLTFSGDRTHDLDGFNMSWINMKEFSSQSISAPSLGNSSFHFMGFGTLDTDVTHRFSSSTGVSAELYGDHGVKFFGGLETDGNIGVSTSPVANRRIYAIDSTDKIGIYMQTNSGNAGYFNASNTNAIDATSGTGYAVVGTGASGGFLGLGGTYGGAFEGSNAGVYAYPNNATGCGVRAFQNTGALALLSDGMMHVKTMGLSVTNESSAVLQISSTTQGFIVPRMTEAQRLAISSPAVGLEVYQTDLADGKYIYKASGWVLVA